MANYTTVREMKNYLLIQDTVSSSEDPLLQTFIRGASNKIDEYVGYDFQIEYGADETLYNVKDLDIIVLKKWPIVGISSIESGVDYQKVDDIGKIILDTPFTGDFSLSVSYGQNPPSIVKTVCMELVNLFWSRRKTVGLQSMSMGDFSISMSTLKKEIDEILEVLSEFRDIHFGRTSPTYNLMR